MAEVIFILVTAYAVYVVHSVVKGKQKVKTKNIVTKSQRTVVEIVSKNTPPPVVKKKTSVKKASTTKTKATASGGNIRNPETGEVAKISASYRMCKRWIKEALVSEGLLEKIYKTNELDDAAKTKIKKALDKLSKMDKYH